MGKANRYRKKVKDPARQPKESPWNQSYRADDVEKQAQLIKINHEVLRGPSGTTFDLRKALEALVRRNQRRFNLSKKY